MKNNGKVCMFVVVFFFAQLSVIFAQDGSTAVLQELSGTVELLHAGSGVWETAERGQVLHADTVVSTGFRSMAMIQAGSVSITVRPLSRLSLSELIAGEGAEGINVNLQAGRVRVDIKTPAGTRADVTVSSPVATASVRGTVFEFDTINMVVSEGAVAFSGALGIAVLVDAGGFSHVDDRNGRVATAEETMITVLKPNLPVTSGLLHPVNEVSETIRFSPAAESTVDVINVITF